MIQHSFRFASQIERHKQLANKKNEHILSRKNDYLYDNKYEKKNRSINNYKK